MSSTSKRPYTQVIDTAERVVEALRPYCQRIEIAGSLRRNRPMVGDIEIVALPTIDRFQTDLFGKDYLEKSRLDYFLQDNNVPLIKDGPKMKQFNYGRFTVDLFLPESSAHWGCIFLIRTGSSQFSKWLMTDAQHQAGLRFKDGRLTRQDLPLDTPEETDVLQALGLPWIPPNMRDDHLWLEQLTPKEQPQS